jgi:predicted RNA binding protein YcfA (HicA-like mRNA interferase family)
VVAIPGHLGDDVPLGTLKAILRAAALEDKK